MEEIVTRPPHYNEGTIETLEYLTQKFGLPYVLGQVSKYCARAEKKGSLLQDIEKAIFYSTWAKEVVLAKQEGRITCKPDDLFPRRTLVSEYKNTSSSNDMVFTDLIKKDFQEVFNEFAPFIYLNKESVKVYIETTEGPKK